MNAGAKHPFKKRQVPEPIPPQHRSVHGIRIIGGQFRGRRLIYNGFVTVRPMRDRVREALFAHLGEQVEGMHVYDLFAGTGAMGLEALSRGAKRVTFVERHFPTLQSIRENVALLGVEDRCELVFGDCFIWGKRLLAPRSSNPWLVFVCPPYAYFHTHRSQLRELLSHLLELAPPGSILVTESDDHYHGEDLPQQVPWEKREYGHTVLWIAKKPTDPSSQEAAAGPNSD